MINDFPPDRQTAAAVEELSDRFRGGACSARNGDENAMSRHAGISKIISAAALAFTVAACTSTAQSRPHQRPASADPIPASSRVAAAPSPAVGVTGLQVDGRAVTSGRKVAITGPVAARRVTGRFTATAPAGDRFFALTTPLTSAASYVQGEIIPGPAGPGPSPSASAPTAATPLPRTGSRSCWPPRQWRRSWPDTRDSQAPCARSRP